MDSKQYFSKGAEILRFIIGKGFRFLQWLGGRFWDNILQILIVKMAYATSGDLD